MSSRFAGKATVRAKTTSLMGKISHSHLASTSFMRTTTRPPWGRKGVSATRIGALRNQRQPVLTNLSCKQAKLRRIAFGRSDRILQAKPHSPRQFQLRWSFPLREIDAGLRSRKGSQNKKPPDWVVLSPCWVSADKRCRWNVLSSGVRNADWRVAEPATTCINTPT